VLPRFCAFFNGVETISRLLKHVGLICKKVLQKSTIFCEMDLYFMPPANRCHPLAWHARHWHSIRNVDLDQIFVRLFCQRDLPNQAVSYAKEPYKNTIQNNTVLKKRNWMADTIQSPFFAMLIFAQIQVLCECWVAIQNQNQNHSSPPRSLLALCEYGVVFWKVIHVI